MAGRVLSRTERNAQTKSRNAKRKAANIERDKNRKKYSPTEQLKRLDFRLGVGVGALKERTKLYARMTNIELAS